jgi:hypothetical protein
MKARNIYVYLVAGIVLISLVWLWYTNTSTLEGFQDAISIAESAGVQFDPIRDCIPLMKQRDSLSQQLEDAKTSMDNKLIRVLTPSLDILQKKISDMKCSDLGDKLVAPPPIPTAEEYAAAKKAAAAGVETPK